VAGDLRLFYGAYEVDEPAEFIVAAWACTAEISIMAFFATGLTEHLPEGKRRLLAAKCPET
jgi:hypothetical protein